MNLIDFKALDREGQKYTLTKFAQAYYEGEPLISDQLFDELYAFYGEDLGIGAGYDPAKHGEETKHLVTPIGNIDTKFKAEDMEGKFDPADIVITTPKLDGASAVAYYRNMKLDKVVSRGDGETGIDITDNIRHAVPAEYGNAEGNAAVRGEILLTWEDFEITGGSHPRNKATGLSQSDGSDLCKYLKFVAFEDMLNDSRNKDTILSQLGKAGFTVPARKAMRYDTFMEMIREKSFFFDPAGEMFLIDGKQIPYDGLILEKAGYRNQTASNGEWTYRYTNHPVAFKFEDESARTVIESIDYQFSRTGRLVPVGNIKTVNLEGANISRVTFNNVQWMQERKIGVGAEIDIIRANMIIPNVKEVHITSEDYQMPTHCPLCNDVLQMEGVDLMCTNDNCTRNEVQIIRNILSRFGPKGMADATIDKFIDHYDINSLEVLQQTVIDDATKTEIKKWGHMGKMLTKAIDNICKKPITLKDLLLTANISRVGNRSSTQIDKNVPAMKFLECLRTGDVSILKAHCTTAPGGEALEKGLDRIKRLSAFWDHELANTADKSSGTETKLTYEVTGKLSMPRNKLIEELAVLGGEHTSIAKADVLITDAPSSSSKYKKAVSRGIQIVTEDEFRQMLEAI